MSSGVGVNMDCNGGDLSENWEADGEEDYFDLDEEEVDEWEGIEEEEVESVTSSDDWYDEDDIAPPRKEIMEHMDNHSGGSTSNSMSFSNVYISNISISNTQVFVFGNTATNSIDPGNVGNIRLPRRSRGRVGGRRANTGSRGRGFRRTGTGRGIPPGGSVTMRVNTAERNTSSLLSVNGDRDVTTDSNDNTTVMMSNGNAELEVVPAPELGLSEEASNSRSASSTLENAAVTCEGSLLGGLALGTTPNTLVSGEHSVSLNHDGNYGSQMMGTASSSDKRISERNKKKIDVAETTTDRIRNSNSFPLTKFDALISCGRNREEGEPPSKKTKPVNKE